MLGPPRALSDGLLSLPPLTRLAIPRASPYVLTAISRVLRRNFAVGEHVPLRCRHDGVPEKVVCTPAVSEEEKGIYRKPLKKIRKYHMLRCIFPKPRVNETGEAITDLLSCSQPKYSIRVDSQI